VFKAGLEGVFRRLGDVLSVINGSGWAEKWTSASPCRWFNLGSRPSRSSSPRSRSRADGGRADGAADDRGVRARPDGGRDDPDACRPTMYRRNLKS